MTAIWTPPDTRVGVPGDLFTDSTTVELPVLQAPVQQVPLQRVRAERVRARRVRAERESVQRGLRQQAAAARDRARAAALAVATGLLLGAGSVVTVLLGTGLMGEAGATGAAPAVFPVVGTVTVPGPAVTTAGSSCTGTGRYGDVREGAPVVVADAAGTIVATGSLGHGRVDALSSPACAFPFTVPSVPAGSAFYLVEVGHHGASTYTGDYLGTVGAAVRLGE